MKDRNILIPDPFLPLSFYNRQIRKKFPLTDVFQGSSYTLRCWKLRFLRVKKWSVSFAGGRTEFRFPTVAIRRSLLQTFGAQLRKINRC